MPIPKQHKQPADDYISLDRLQIAAYVALVGSADFQRSGLSEIEICRTAYRRSAVAVRVWQEQKQLEANEDKND